MFQDYYRGKKVLITGHTGFKGSWMAAWLLRLGAKVSGVALDPPSEPSHFDLLGLSGKVSDHRCDIRDLAKLKKVFESEKPEIVFHLAAQPLVRDSYDDPVGTFATNVMGTLHVLECARLVGGVKSLTVVTSDKCYENREWEFGYRETDRVGGKDPYSASKGCTEILASSYFRSFLGGSQAGTGAMPRMVSVRAGNVIGGGDWAKDRIVPDAVRAWSAGKPLTIRSPLATRPWQHVLEPISGYLWLEALLGSDGQDLHGGPLNGEAFNFGPHADADRTVEDLLGELSRGWKGARWEVDAGGTGAKREAGLLKLNWDKAWSRMEWSPVMKFEESVKTTVDWYSGYYIEKKSPAELTARDLEAYENLARERGLAWTR